MSVDQKRALIIMAVPAQHQIHSIRLQNWQDPLAHVGLNSFHQPGYSGPCPPAGAPHRYVFTLRALSQSGRVLAEANLTGRFGR